MGKRGYLPEFPLALGCRFPALQRELVDPHARRVDSAAEDTRAGGNGPCVSSQATRRALVGFPLALISPDPSARPVDLRLEAVGQSRS
jgi:hypothetical protein